MSNTSDDLQAVGSDTRPLMLDRTDYESWAQRIRLYCRGKENGVNILQLIDNGPYQMGTTRDRIGTTNDGGVTLRIDRPRTYNDLDEHEKKRFDADIQGTNIVLQGLPKDIYKLINHNTEAKAIWDNVKMILASSELTKEDCKSQLYNEFECFKMILGATGSGNAQNRAGNANQGQEKSIKFYNCGGFGHIARNYTQLKRPQNSDYFKEKMLLMQAQENGAVLDEEELLFLADVDDEPIAQTIFMANFHHEIPNEVQQTNVFDSGSADMGHSNVIPYEQYVKHNEESVVPSGASSVQYDDYMLHEKSAYVSDDSFTITLNIYKDQTRAVELRAENLNLHKKIQNDDHDNMVKHLLRLEPLESQNFQLHDTINKLQKENDCFQAKNLKIKQHYKELYDSIKIMCATHIEKITSLLNEIKTLKTQVKGKIPVIPNEHVIPKVFVCNKYAIDVEPIPPSQRNNRNVQQGYLNHLKDTLDTLREIVEEARSNRPSDSSLEYACIYTKTSQELLKNVIASCPKTVNKRDIYNASTHAKRNKHVTFAEPLETSPNNTSTHVKQLNDPKTNVLAIPSTGVNSVTKASRSPPRSNTNIDRTLTAKSGHKKNVEAHLRNNKSDLHKKNHVDFGISFKRVVVNSNSNSHCKTYNKCMISFNHDELISFNHDECVAKFPKSSNKSPVKKIWRVKQVKQT
nr:retrovirus-related Pol polyprotein from transposon TNT 1-94 [Tanacetum cinerariifolium]